MRVLVLGGSGFLGAAVVRRALGAGHQVTCLTRGVSGATPDGATHLVRDRDDPDALAGLDGGAWDAVVDVTSQPGRVRRAVRALGAAHYLYVSSVSVYADTRTTGQDASAPVVEPLAQDTATSIEQYGAAKVACERFVLDGAATATVVRPGLIGGAGDGTGRSTYWPWRMAHPADAGGRVLVPEAPELVVQLIDVVDLADWIVHLLATRRTGLIDAVGDPVPFPAALEAAQRAAGVEREWLPADGGWLAARGVSPWAGARSLPLWLDDPAWSGFMTRRNDAAKAAGLALRPLTDTFRAALRWQEGTGDPPASGLADAEERELLAVLG